MNRFFQYNRFNPCNKFELSEMILTIPRLNVAIIIIDKVIKTITADVFLFKLVFFDVNLIIGSTVKDIIKAIKNGI